MAWAALENALAASISGKSREPIEQLRRSDFIPLGHALFGLAESMTNRWLLKRETIASQLRAMRYLESGLSLRYGRAPWRVLPAAVRETFLKKRPDPPLRELLNEVFDGFPEALSEATGADRLSGQAARSPSQAA
jgi:hypothetical protein